MNNNQQQPVDERIMVKYNVGDDEIKLSPSIVQQYLTDGKAITLPEFKMFASLCKARGLNPFLKEAYIIKFGSLPAQIVVGKDAILKRAILNPDFDGREQGIIVLNEDGQTIEKNGTFILQSELLVGGWAKVYRKNWTKPVYITVTFSEVANKKRDGNLNSNWLNQGATMVEKVALVRALREAFVEDTAGMYEAEELTHIPEADLNQDNEEIIIDQSESQIEEAEIIEQSSDSETVNIKDI